MPRQIHPDLLVGFDTRDDGGVFRVREDLALIQTLDFFTPVVDDPYWYGMIAAANALSDVYAMGGTPITVMNIACFDPTAALPEIWADVLKGMADKSREAGAAIVGGHSVEDKEPKFGMSVTGVVHPDRVFSNALGQAGQDVYLSKPIGVGIATTAAKNDACPAETLNEATLNMAALNAAAMEAAQAVGVRCATDVTGFGLAGHLFNIARASKIGIEISVSAVPLITGVLELRDAGYTTGGARKNRDFLGDALQLFDGVDAHWIDLVCDPQTSGGLAVLSSEPVAGSVWIGRTVEGDASILLRP